MIKERTLEDIKFERKELELRIRQQELQLLMAQTEHMKLQTRLQSDGKKIT